jgi:hypothetical protein
MPETDHSAAEGSGTVRRKQVPAAEGTYGMIALMNTSVETALD